MRSHYAVGIASLASSLGLSTLLSFGGLARPAAAAERVTLTFGFAEVSTSVEALRAYGERGEISNELKFYLGLLSEEQRLQFRQALQARQDIEPYRLSKFLRSSIGNNILRYLGDVVQTAGRRDGSRGLRGALVLSAAEPEGLSLLGVLENFPTSTVRIDSLRGFQIVSGITAQIEDTSNAIAAVKNRSALTFQNDPLTALPDLFEPGPYDIQTQVLNVYDASRDRTLPTTLYLPQGIATPLPLIVASHGLAGNREGFDPIARHLTSYGYAVATIDHPGSNRRQFEGLLGGVEREIAEPTEFTDRPRDLSYLLDELTRLNGSGALANRFNLEQVGVIGHSFGGYTALVIAGAEMNYDNLRANCDSTAFVYSEANTSMLLQCTALAAPEQFAIPVEDDRIKAVIAMNPVTSSVFGPAGFTQLDIPSLLIAGSSDPVAPALAEQIQPFTWLNRRTTDAPDHYLALVEGGSHLYDPPTLESADVSLANGLVNADVELAYRYLKALSLAFMQAEVVGDRTYLDALGPSYVGQLSSQPLPLFVVDSLTEADLVPASPTPPVTEGTEEEAIPAEVRQGGVEAPVLEETSPEEISPESTMIDSTSP